MPRISVARWGYGVVSQVNCVTRELESVGTILSRASSLRLSRCLCLGPPEPPCP